MTVFRSRNYWGFAALAALLGIMLFLMIHKYRLNVAPPVPQPEKRLAIGETGASPRILPNSLHLPPSNADRGIPSMRNEGRDLVLSWPLGFLESQ
jgi:hypothetical protein